MTILWDTLRLERNPSIGRALWFLLHLWGCAQLVLLEGSVSLLARSRIAWWSTLPLLHTAVPPSVLAGLRQLLRLEHSCAAALYFGFGVAAHGVIDSPSLTTSRKLEVLWSGLVGGVLSAAHPRHVRSMLGDLGDCCGVALRSTAVAVQVLGLLAAGEPRLGGTAAALAFLPATAMLAATSVPASVDEELDSPPGRASAPPDSLLRQAQPFCLSHHSVSNKGLHEGRSSWKGQGDTRQWTESSTVRTAAGCGTLPTPTHDGSVNAPTIPIAAAGDSGVLTSLSLDAPPAEDLAARHLTEPAPRETEMSSASSGSCVHPPSYQPPQDTPALQPHHSATRIGSVSTPMTLHQVESVLTHPTGPERTPFVVMTDGGPSEDSGRHARAEMSSFGLVPAVTSAVREAALPHSGSSQSLDAELLASVPAGCSRSPPEDVSVLSIPTVVGSVHAGAAATPGQALLGRLASSCTHSSDGDGSSVPVMRAPRHAPAVPPPASAARSRAGGSGSPPRSQSQSQSSSPGCPTAPGLHPKPFASGSMSPYPGGGGALTPPAASPPPAVPAAAAAATQDSPPAGQPSSPI
eukprot:TRINITY_DN17105_c0_g1_i1.p1 TRINITY_DN17105_c0_g1~~TRINITY_DN17105_c0_g1_i1.p1  ORF type:complete len:577 (+),score=131.80 TRINITY_DN17105_c0_g1_i1:59-1789(+)